MAEKKQIGPRINDKTASWLAETFSSTSAGAEFVLDANRVLYARTLKGLKNEFTRGELMAMIDVMNSHFLTAFSAGTELILSLGDAIEMEGLAEKWQIDGAKLITDLSLMSAYELACLEWWANGFWYGGGSDRPERDLEAYVAALAKNEA
jgi:hypothetical protein